MSMTDDELTCYGIGLLVALCSTVVILFSSKARSLNLGLKSANFIKKNSEKGWTEVKSAFNRCCSRPRATNHNLEREQDYWILMDEELISTDQESADYKVLDDGQKLNLQRTSKSKVVYIPKDQENCISQSSSLLKSCQLLERADNSGSDSDNSDTTGVKGLRSLRGRFRPGKRRRMPFRGGGPRRPFGRSRGRGGGRGRPRPPPRRRGGYPRRRGRGRRPPPPDYRGRRNDPYSRDDDWPYSRDRSRYRTPSYERRSRSRYRSRSRSRRSRTRSRSRGGQRIIILD